MKNLNKLLLLVIVVGSFSACSRFDDPLEKEFKKTILEHAKKIPELVSLPEEEISDAKRKNNLKWEKENYKIWISSLSRALNDNPDSRWADDTAYYLLELREGLRWLEDETSKSNELPELTKFITDYPEAEFEVWSKKYLPHTFASFDFLQMPDYIKIHHNIFMMQIIPKTKNVDAINYGESIIKKYPEYKKEFEKTIKILKKQQL